MSVPPPTEFSGQLTFREFLDFTLRRRSPWVRFAVMLGLALLMFVKPFVVEPTPISQSAVASSGHGRALWQQLG